MIRSEEYIRGFDDSEIYVQSWECDDPRAWVIITHGLGEHSDAYEILAQRLVSENLNVVAWDLRGHGHSDGERGVVGDFQEFSKDLNNVISFIQPRYENLKGHAIGHSLGGLVLSRRLVDYGGVEFESVILSSPLFGVALSIPQLKEKLGRFVSRMLPDLTLYNELRLEDLSRDPEIVESYRNDPLRHDKISVRLFLEIMSNCEYVIGQASKISVPLLIQQAGDDKIVDIKKTRQFFNQVSSDRKRLMIYDDYYHEVYKDRGRERVYLDLLSWIELFEGK